MDKYGVDQDLDDKKKTASEKNPTRCPTCGRNLRPSDETNILLCPQCGSLPFEVE